MAVLIRPRSWGLTKPPPGSRIDWSHPLADDLIFCCIPNSVGAPLDLVTGQSAALSSAFTDYPVLRDHVHMSAQTASWSSYAGRAITAPDRGVTMMTKHYFATVPGTTYLPFFTLYGSFKGGRFRISNNNNTTFQWSDNIAGGDEIESGPPFVAMREYVQAGVYDRSVGYRIYMNGAPLVANATTTPTLLAPGSGPVLGNASLNMGFAYAYAWWRPLSADQIAWLYAEPYAFIRPPRPVVLDMAAPVTPGYMMNRYTIRHSGRR